MFTMTADFSDPWLTGRLVRKLLLVAALLFVCFALIPASNSQASQDKGAVAGNVPGGVLSNSSDAEYWRQVRHGAQGSVVGVNSDRGLLIQADGTQWWQTRTNLIGKYLAWALLGTIALLALFFAIRGRIRIDGGMSGVTILRFALIERLAHWMLASSFIVLALTGLNLLYGRALLIPIFGKDFFSTMAVGGKYIHDFVGFAFIVSLIMVAMLWVVHNIPSKEDLVWFLRGGGIIGHGHPSARKFNAGQKILFWLIILCGISIALSGWTLLYPFTTSMFSGTFEILNSVIGTEFAVPLAAVQEQQLANQWHVILAGVMMVTVLAHIYIGTIGMEGAVSAMTSGEVDLNWAKEHHDLWVEEANRE